MDYLTLKTLHVLGVVLFVGNIVVTALWKAVADRSRKPSVIAFGTRLVLLTDAVFTLPGVILILLTGLAMSGGHAAIAATPWLAWGFGLFIASGLLWLLVLVPVQFGQARLALQSAAAAEMPPRYWQLARIWMVAGTIATVLPLVNIYLMVGKPA